jgi:hypothetical protein
LSYIGITTLICGAGFIVGHQCYALRPHA